MDFIITFLDRKTNQNPALDFGSFLVRMASSRGEDEAVLFGGDGDETSEDGNGNEDGKDEGMNITTGNTAASDGGAVRAAAVADAGKVLMQRAIIITTARTVLGTRPDLGPKLIDAAKKQDGLADIQPLIDQGAPVDFQVTS